MDEVGMFDAKTHFSEIVDRVVTEGRSITITRRGVPVVDIVPHGTGAKKSGSWEETLAELERLRETLPRFTTEEIREAIDEGRQ